MAKWEELLSRLGEVRFQLNALNRYSLMNQPELPKLLAVDVEKALVTLGGARDEVRQALADLDLSPDAAIPTDLRSRLIRIKDALGV